MYFFHSEKVWQQFPQLVAGAMHVSDINAAAGQSVAVGHWIQKGRDRLAKQQESQFPEVIAWRKVYSQMGLKPSKYRSAAEALLRRLRKTGDLPRLHPLVDICNAVSVAFALPVAVFDVDKIKGNLEVCMADGSEEYLAFNGGIEHPHKGEIIFKDESGHAHARRWTFRQSKLSTVSESTRQAMIISEGMDESAKDNIPRLLNELRREVLALGFACSRPVILTQQNPCFVLPD